jgi:hypothetical protein
MSTGEASPANGSATAHNQIVPSSSSALSVALEVFRGIAAQAQQAVKTLEGQPILGGQRRLPDMADQAAVLTPGAVSTALQAPPTTSSRPSASAMALVAGEMMIWQSTGGADSRFGHNAGVSSGANWECRYNTDKQGNNIFDQYGPYLSVPPGRYRVEFDLWSQSCWAMIQVTSNMGSKMIWSSHTKGDPNPSGGKWHTFSSPDFSVDANGEQNVEFRVSWHTDPFHDHSLVIGQTRLIQVPDAPVAFATNAISYNVAAAVISDPVVVDGGINVQQFTNETSVQQGQTASGSITTTSTSGWSNATQVSISVQAGVQVGIPLFVNGTLTVTASVSDTVTVSGTTSSQQVESWSNPISVPPHATLKAITTVTKTQVTVPYTLTGTYTYASGRTAPGSMSGAYTGVAGYNISTDVQSA